MNDAGVFFGQHLHARVGRVDALLQRFEIQTVVGGDDDLAVDHAARRQFRADGGDELGKVPGQRPLVAAAQLDVEVVAEADRPEPVPLGLIGRAGRDRRHRFGQHRRDRRHHGQSHLLIVADDVAISRRFA